MQNFFNKKHLILLIIALIPSLAFVKYSYIENVPFCLESPGCQWSDEVLKGRLSSLALGYPLEYRLIKTFKAQPNNSGLNESRYEAPSFNIASIVINIIFWFGLIDLSVRLFKNKRAS